MKHGLFGALAALCLSACGEEAADEKPTTSETAIAVLTRVCGPDNCQHYLSAFDELPADQQIDRSRSAESGNTQGVVFNGAIYIFDRDSNSVTRWTVDEQLSLQQGDTVSFLNTGVTDACAICNVFGTATRAHLVDSTAGVIVTWNPTTMEIVSSQDLPEELLTRDDLPAGIAWPFVIDGRAFMAASWVDYDSRNVYPRAAVATFDATADRPVVSVIEDDRCGVSSVAAPFADESGNVYVVGDWFGGVQQIGTLDPLAPNPACLLRITPGAAVFDPDYYVDLLASTDASAIAGAYAMAGGNCS